MTRKRKENPQKELSKEWLSAALIELMHEKEYGQITITEVASRADLSRRTFYRHFTSIAGILDHTLESIGKDFGCLLLENQGRDLYISALNYFEYWQQHKDILVLLKENHLLHLLLEKFMPAVRDSVAIMHRDTEESAMVMDYAFYFAAGGLWNLLVKWLEDGAQQSPGEMATIAVKIIESIK